MDLNNPVVALCAEGIQAELAGRRDEARALFLQAWDARRDACEACVAAHYVARHQDTAEEALRWNAEALARADEVGDERVRSFYPSLYLNLGRSYETLGDLQMARALYELGTARVADVPEGGYGDVVRRGLHDALQRTAAPAEASG